MKLTKKAQAGMNVFQCTNKKCEGTGFVPVTLRKSAEIRTLGTEREEHSKFTCGHFHSVILRCGHMHSISRRDA